MTPADKRAAKDPHRSRFLPYLASSRGVRAGKWVSGSEAVAAIADHSRIFVSAASGTPMGVLEALAENRDRWSDLELVMAFMVQRPSVFEYPGKPFRYTTTQASPAFKYLWDTGTVSILPARYSDLSGLFLDSGAYPVDVALVQVSAPGPEGRVSLGTSAGGSIDIARNAPLVIAQVNERVPYTYGASEFEISEFDYLVSIPRDVKLVPPTELSSDKVLQSIARSAAENIADGSTLQFGIGQIPDAILSHLGTHKNLSVHSGMFSMACAELLEKGAISNTSKGFDDGYMIAAEVSNTEPMAKWINRNPQVLMAPARYSHGAAVLGKIPRFVSLQSGIEVALDGSVNSETVKGRIISGPGGAPDFAFAANASMNGRSILALKSVAGKGSISRIVKHIEAPDRVTLPYYTADIIVTEHGLAEVRGLSFADRARALRDIAHPDHRAGLE
ncbi:MAG: hypothetical protein KUG75_04490 [Pseudomonadales bacterium]|nr:hypothetical protein [Pseudomonadales bacterium]